MLAALVELAMMKLFHNNGAVEIKSSNAVPTSVLMEIDKSLTKCFAEVKHTSEHSLHFKSNVPFFLRWSHSPLLGISSGNVSISSTGTKLVVSYELNRTALFWLCTFIVSVFAVLLFDNIINSKTHEIFAYAIGFILLYIVQYATAFGVNGHLFDQLLLKAANKSLNPAALH